MFPFHPLHLKGFTHRVYVAEGGDATIPCKGGLRIAGDQPTLVLWYRQGNTEAIYR